MWMEHLNKWSMEHVTDVVRMEFYLVLFSSTILGLVNIFKSGRQWSHKRDFIYIKCCAKGFFSEINILGGKWLLKVAKENEKMRFFLQWTGIRKSFRI